MKLSIFGFFALSLINVASASNYPPDYSYQTVRLLHDGPAVIAGVTSGTTEPAIVIGYGNNGYLTRSNPHAVDAIITGQCGDGYSNQYRQTNISLGREWHGAGYLSQEMSIWNLLPRDCQGVGSLQVAYSDGRGNWDSRHGQNYYFDLRNPNLIVYKTNEGSGFARVNMRAWDFIISEMRR